MSRRGKIDRETTSASLSNDQIEDFKAAFKIYSDNDPSGYLTAEALGRVLQRAGVRGNPEEMLKEAGGQVDSMSFQTMMARKLGQGETRESVENAFQTFDWKRTGRIPRNEMENALTTMGEPVPRAQLTEVMNLCDGPGGEFYWTKFVEALFGAKAD